MPTEEENRSIRVLPHLVIAVFFLRSFMLLYKPVSLQTERLWLEWLGARILNTGKIPHMLGHEALASAGAPWIPQSWLFATALSWCARRGFDIIPIIVVTCVAAIPAIVTFIRMRRDGVDTVAITVALLFVTTTIDLTLDMRAAMFSYAAAALVFAALSCRDYRQYSIPLLVLALVNIHATALFLAGLPLLAFFLKLATERIFQSDAKRLLITSAASIAASLCSPFGVSLYSFTFSLTGGAAHHNIYEWTPILSDLGSNTTATQFGESILLTALLIAWCKRRPLDAVQLSVIIVTGALMLYAERFAVLFIIAAAPLALRNGFRLPTMPFAALHTHVFVWFFTGMLLTSTLVPVLRHVVYDTSVQLPNRPGFRVSAEWLEPWYIGLPAHERVFCSNFAYCNRYLWAGASDVLDGRTDPFPIGVYDSTKRINGMHMGWKSEIAKLHINIMVIEHCLPKLAAAVAALPGWRKVASTEDNDTYMSSLL